MIPGMTASKVFIRVRKRQLSDKDGHPVLEVARIVVETHLGTWPETIAARDLDLALRFIRVGASVCGATIEETIT